VFRDAEVVRRAFVTEADYIKVHQLEGIDSFAFWDYGPELSRRFRALKVWLTLKYYGARRIAAAISDDMAMAQYMEGRMTTEAEFELLAPVQLSICCFRFVPGRLREELALAGSDEAREEVNAKLNRLNERIMGRIQRGGRAYLSNAMLRGRFALRACIINFRTTRADIDPTLQAAQEAAQAVALEDESR